MELILLSFTIMAAVFGATAAVLYTINRWHDDWLQRQLLQQKQLAVYEEITRLIGDVKATLEYSSGDETLGEWRSALMGPLHQMLCKSYEWSVFLPNDLQELPSRYASRVARQLKKLDDVLPAELDSYASIIEELKSTENEAAIDFQKRIRETVGIYNMSSRLPVRFRVPRKRG